MWIFEGTAFQAAGTTRAKALRLGDSLMFSKSTEPTVWFSWQVPLGGLKSCSLSLVASQYDLYSPAILGLSLRSPAQCSGVSRIQVQCQIGKVIGAAPPDPVLSS